MHDETHSSLKLDLALDWAEKWLELIGLINEVTASSVPPTDTQELLYQSLRFWFMDHQLQFGRLWEDFTRYLISRPRYSGGDSAEIEGLDVFPETPYYCFYYFYEPENLHRLAHHLELQSGTALWEPSECEASTIRPLLVGLGEMIIEFSDWISNSSESIQDN